MDKTLAENNSPGFIEKTKHHFQVEDQKMHPCISAVPAWKHVFRHFVGLIDSVKLRKFTFSKKLYNRFKEHWNKERICKTYVLAVQCKHAH